MSAPPDLLLLLLQLEVPDCGCKLKKKSLCLTAFGPDGCHERRRPRCFTRSNQEGCKRQREYGECSCPPRGKCDCPYLPGPACPHILARNHGLSLEDWAKLLRRYLPDEYRSLKPPPFPTISPPSRPDKVRMMISRVARGCQPFHPLDIHAEQIEDVRIGYRVGLNGRPIRSDDDEIVSMTGQEEGDADDFDIEGEAYWNWRTNREKTA